MMKRIFTATAAALLAMSISNSAFAHSHVTGTIPADGEVVTEEVNEIVLNFDGQIEQGSFIDVTTSEGQEVEIQEIIIGEGTLTGTVAEPLPNDEYEVNWNIISADGHPLEGGFSFTVNAPVPENVEEETVEPTEAAEPATEDQEEAPTEKANEVEESNEVEEANNAEEASSSTTVLLIVVLVVIAAGSFFFVRKRKK
ncbi:copper resistance CopC family protein [Bacillus dakarensis]|uniref:copper resistance CopC family protein n=1 Tax=Robertmurraya dakarensis TaxID=1926278 RepID=UPI000A01E8D6|nr:copper resistance protein CopC [Bacillus dakarensis]